MNIIIIFKKKIKTILLIVICPSSELNKLIHSTTKNNLCQFNCLLLLYILSLLLENGMLIVFSLSNFVCRHQTELERDTHICDFLGWNFCALFSLLLLLALSLCSFPYYLNKQVFSKIQASNCKALSLARKVQGDTTHLHIQELCWPYFLKYYFAYRHKT